MHRCRSLSNYYICRQIFLISSGRYDLWIVMPCCVFPLTCLVMPDPIMLHFIIAELLQHPHQMRDILMTHLILLVILQILQTTKVPTPLIFILLVFCDILGLVTMDLMLEADLLAVVLSPLLLSHIGVMGLNLLHLPLIRLHILQCLHLRDYYQQFQFNYRTQHLVVSFTNQFLQSRQLVMANPPP